VKEWGSARAPAQSYESEHGCHRAKGQEHGRQGLENFEERHHAAAESDRAQDRQRAAGDAS
jgi:hypothetical protein